MNEQAEAVTTKASGLSAGDWTMAVVSFFLTPLVSVALAIYSFARSRQSQGLLYLGVFGAQVLIFLIIVAR